MQPSRAHTSKATRSTENRRLQLGASDQTPPSSSIATCSSCPRTGQVRQGNRRRPGINHEWHAGDYRTGEVDPVRPP